MNACYAILERAIALAGLVAVSPILLIAACCILIEDGRPVLFRQRRVGRFGRYFEILKFRSMRTGAAGPAITAGGDRRITGTGAFLRRFKIDELPQLWNVIAGDMSLVGPRPEVPRYVDLADERWKKVLRVKPGISDLATLTYRNEEELLAGTADPDRTYREIVLPRKLELNIRYIEHRSPLSDLRLLLLTVRYSFLPWGFQSERIERSFSVKTP